MRKDDLTAQIERKRKEMMELANKHGFTSSKALELSQDLDQLINLRIKESHPSNKQDDPLKETPLLP
ncbi:aspartyl-phosphate phosphatase Spo0E family protein [Paenalkalicoccus suaedae]|uniref:Aspartyl-phosphate phosphatase Spo0E family protein n=1 Tax=Paenalkalicoccus suaedae TaxID=2592382 RepID=A0A859FC85_9BACI|nr:aspartyl-phosphate phosphatase Spo0E family protein [Paenalkalicoccus suaedae]QKS70677.1 aspartyl-phosphate phosphatase Spo0E family protein [Paenalkalicoccus suaedae]